MVEEEYREIHLRLFVKVETIELTYGLDVEDKGKGEASSWHNYMKLNIPLTESGRLKEDRLNWKTLKENQEFNWGYVGQGDPISPS